MTAGVEPLTTERIRLNAILQCMGEGLLVVDDLGNVTLVNPTFCTLFGLDTDPTGQSLANVCNHPVLLDAIRAVQQSRVDQTNEIVLTEPPRSTLHARFTPVVTDGKRAEVLAIFRDISVIKHLQRGRRDLVTNVSHELRTPLAIISGYAETLASNVVDPEQVTRFATIIQNHTSRLTSLVNDMLTLSELETEGFHLSLTPVCLPEIITYCCNLFNAQASIRGISVDLSDMPLTGVLVDSQRFVQLLGNLLGNAFRFTPEGGRVTVGATVDGEFVKITVCDTGPGIPMDEQALIFERFYRTDAGRSREHGGTGLGLAIVKHLVRLHGGKVGVESVPGQGACFFFTLKRG